MPIQAGGAAPSFIDDVAGGECDDSHLQQAPLSGAPKGQVLALRVSAKQLRAVGSFGRIFDFDPVAGWRVEQSGSQILLTALAGPSAPTAHYPLLVVGHDGVILRKSAANAAWVTQWQRVNPEYPVTWLDVLQLNAQHALVVGAYGQYAVTRDAGKNWQLAVLDLELEAHLNDIVLLKDGRLFIAAEAGVQYWSSDNGQNWYADGSFPYEGAMFTAQPWGDSGVLVAGMLGHVFVADGAIEGLRLLEADAVSDDDFDDDWSDDDAESGGVNDKISSAWRRLPVASQKSFYASVKLENGDVILAGQAGALFRVDAETEVVSEISAPIFGTVSDIAETPDGLIVATDLGVQKLAPVPGDDCVD